MSLPTHAPPGFLPGQPRAAGGDGRARAANSAAGVGSSAPAVLFRTMLLLPARCATPQCERAFIPAISGGAGRCERCHDLARAIADANRAALRSHHRARGRA